MCPPEVDDSTFSDLMLTRAEPVPVTNNSKGRFIEPEGEPEGEVIWASKPSWGQSLMTVPMKKPAILGTTNLPNLIRKTGMCMMILSALALNLTVIGALLKSHQTAPVAPNAAVKPKSVVTRPVSSSLRSLPPMQGNATSKADAKLMPESESAPQQDSEEPPKQLEDPSEKVMSDSAAHFIIPVPMPPKIPLPPTVQEHVPDPVIVKAREEILASSTLKLKDPQTVGDDIVSENQNGLSVKLVNHKEEEIKSKDEVPEETEDQKEDRERKRLRALLVEAEEDLADGGSAAVPTYKVDTGNAGANKKQSTGSGRLHSQDPFEITNGRGGGMMAKWGSEIKGKLENMGADEAARSGPTKFMRMDSTSFATLDHYTRTIREAQAKRKKDEPEETAEPSLFDEVQKALPSTVFGFR